MFKHFSMIEERTTCGSCEKKFAGVNGKEMRKPRFSPCIHTFCTECLLAEEAKAQQEQQGGSVPPTPCMYCGHASSVPVAELKLHIGLMRRIDANAAGGGGGGGGGGAVAGAAVSPLPCDVSKDEDEDEATPASAMFDALFAEVVMASDKAVAAAAVNKTIRGELEGSRDAAFNVADDALNRLAQAVHHRKGEMKLLVTSASDAAEGTGEGGSQGKGGSSSSSSSSDGGGGVEANRCQVQSVAASNPRTEESDKAAGDQRPHHEGRCAQQPD